MSELSPDKGNLPPRHSGSLKTRWVKKFLGMLDGFGFALVTAPVAYWIGTREKPGLGYLISACAVGFLFAIFCVRAWIRRKLNAIEAAEKQLAEQRVLQSREHNLHFQLDLITITPTTPVIPRTDLRERLEKWLDLIDKKNRTLFRLGRLLSGVCCMGAGIAIFVVNHGARSWGGSALLGTGGLLLGAPTVLDFFMNRTRRRERQRGE